MDEIDRASAQSAVWLDAEIAEARTPVRAAKATGECLWCGEPVEQGRRWCCPECRDEWEKRNEKQVH